MTEILIGFPPSRYSLAFENWISVSSSVYILVGIYNICCFLQASNRINLCSDDGLKFVFFSLVKARVM